MSWFSENLMTILVTGAVAGYVLRAPVMSRVYHVEQISVHDLAARMRSSSPPVVLDVRTPMEYQRSRIENAIPVPLGELGSRIEALKRQYDGRELAVICQSGSRSLSGSVILKKAGFEKVANVLGGVGQWQSQGYPLIQ